MRFPTSASGFALFTSLLSISQALPSSNIDVVAVSTTPTAETKNGTYVGRYLPEYAEDLFLGMPYAQPPVGDLRFRVPQSLNTSFTGQQMATDYSAECVGYGSDQWGYTISEDCLYLNVIRPHGTKASAALPVAVWIHGGGYVEGGSPDKRYNLSFIVQNSVEIGTPMVAVSLNYRLSAWGLLASGPVAGSGNTNLALRDQRLALHWVQENIAAFGGDPTKVTIWGESAGASSVGYHLTAYNGRDDKLFHQAIMESGNPVQYSPQYTADYYDSQYQLLVNAVNCTDAADTLGCLRTIPYDTLNAAINTSALTGWDPIIDGDFVQRYGSLQLAGGNFVHVPIISGANSDEGTSFGPLGINTTAEFVQHLASGEFFPSVILPTNVAQAIVVAYPDNPCVGIPSTLGCLRPGPPYGAEYRRTSAYAGDAVFIAARRLTCQTWAGAGVSAYCYRDNGWVDGLTEYTGVGHFQEVGLVFDNTMGVGYDAAPDPFADRGPALVALAHLMSCSWASFVATGNPNTWRETNTAIPLWPVYDVSDPRVIVWESNVTTHLEADTFRAAGIATINSYNVLYHR